MGYQPIQMPGPRVNLFEGPGFVETFQRARAAQQEQDRQRAELLLRQRNADAAQQESAQRMALAQQEAEARRAAADEDRKRHRAGVITQIASTLNTDPQMARQMAAAYGIKLEDVVGPKHGEGDTLAPMGTTQTVKHDPVTVPTPMGSGTINVPQDDTTEYTPSAPNAPKAPAQAFRIEGVDYDPEMTRIGQREAAARNAEIQRKAFASLGPKYGDLAASMATGADPKVAGIVAQAYERDTARESASHEKELQRDFTRTQNSDYRRTFEQAKELARIQAAAKERAAMMFAQNPLKVDAAARGDQATLRQELKALDQTTGITKLVAARDALHSAIGNLEPGSNPLQHRDAQIQLARALRGAMPTDSETHILYSGLGGILDKPDQWIARAENGDLSATQQRYLMESIRALDMHLNTNIDSAYGTYNQGLGADPAFQNMGESVNAQVKARFKRLGRDVPDVVKGAAGTAVLGAGRSGQVNKDAGRAAMLKDPQVRGALEYLKRNPNDEQVKAELRRRGVEVP